MRFLLLIGLLFLSSVADVSAQTDTSSFNIRVLAGEDTSPPTTPTLLSVTPVSPNQIDITWSTATDNFVVQGYVLTRGTSTVATTTLTTFSDSSVSASTTYAYTVRAFDNSLNYSSSSNSLSTTTPDFPVIIPEEVEDTRREGTVARIVTRDVLIEPGVSTSSFSVETARPVRLTVRWGRTSSYELGYLVSEYYSDTHATLLTDLEPGTTYEYEIIAETPFGLQSVIQTGQFTTVDPSNSTLPANVARFRAAPNADDVQLSWQLPPAEDVAYVRIVRSHLGFPAHPRDGAVVYQGLNLNFTDQDVLSVFSPVYYTAFVFDSSGRVSSGALAFAYAQSDAEEVVDDSANRAPLSAPDISTTPDKVVEPTAEVETDRVTSDMRLPELSEILINQAGREYSFIGPQIVLSSTEAFTVRIPASAVAGNLKSIIGTLLDPTDNRQSYSFLLRINADKSHYEAVVSALSVEGQSVLEVAVYDYEAFVVATYSTPVSFTVLESAAEPVLFPDVFFREPVQLLLAGTLLGAVLLVLMMVFRYRHEDKV